MRDGGKVEADGLSRARVLLEAAERVVVLSGAGMSAESGVPTFRGPEGLWKRWRPEELATPAAFRRDPRLVWEWYGWRRATVAACAPNPGHRAVAALQVRRRSGRDEATGVRVVTQNVDGLHERAVLDALGPASASLAVDDPLRPVELHGSLFRVRCTACSAEAPHREDVDATSTDTLPRCAACGGLLRPAVVWFGEALDPVVLESAFDAAGRADVCLVVGTSARVHPAASVPLATLRAGGVVVEVNPEPTPLSGVAAVTLRGSAGEALPLLLRA